MGILLSFMTHFHTTTSATWAGFYTKLNVWGSLGLNFDYDEGPIFENRGPIFLYIYCSFNTGFMDFRVLMSDKNRIYSSVKGFEQALAVNQVSQNIKSFLYLDHLYWPNQIDRNFQSFFGAVFLDDSDLSESKQPLEDGSWSVSAFLLPKTFLRPLCFDILAAVYF